MTPKQKKLLKPWSELYARLEERLENMGDDELRELLDAARSASQTNCWVMTYSVSRIIAPAATKLLAQRDYARRKKITRTHPES